VAIDDARVRLLRLIEGAQSSGFIQLEDLDGVVDADGSNLDGVLSALPKAGVHVADLDFTFEGEAEIDDTVSIYLREVAAVPRLTPHEARKLAELMCSKAPEAGKLQRRTSSKVTWDPLSPSRAAATVVTCTYWI
jgi:hypothetical protein